MSKGPPTLQCPRCGATHELSDRRPGERFDCPCGNVLQVPPRARLTGWRKAVLVLALFTLPCFLAAGAGVLYLWREQRTQEAEAAAQGEARINVSILCDNVSEFASEHGRVVPAGPQPPDVPRGRAVTFPEDPAFQQLGFAPGAEVRYQYEVQVLESPTGEPEVRCIARGDLDGDGKVSVYTVGLDANGMKGPVQVEDEGE